MKATLCFVILLIRWMLRFRVYESNRDIAKGIDDIRLGESRCLFCRNCKLMWYLANAIKQKDPYRIVEIYKILGGGGKIDNSSELSEYISESFAWTSWREWSDAGYRKSSASNIIYRWRNGDVSPDEAGSIATTPSRLCWPLFIVLGAIRESSGDKHYALQNYQKAFRVMPKWLPEAEDLYRKINDLRRDDF